MPETYYEAQNLDGDQIEAALNAIDGVIAPKNNGKILAIEAGKIVAKSASEWTDVPVLEPVTIRQNGTTTPPTGVDGFNSVTVAVPGAGNIEPLAVTENGTYSPPSGVDGYAPVTVNVSGGSGETYAFIVVNYPVGATCTASNGNVLITAPDTSGHAVFAIPSAGTWTIAYVSSSGQASLSVNIQNYGESQSVSFILPSAYKEVEYLEIGSSAGPYINIAYNLNSLCEFEVKSQYTSTPNSNSWLFGAYVSGKQTNLGYTQSRIYIQTGGSNVTFTLDTLQHVYASKQNAFYCDGVAQTGAVPNWANTVTVPARLFYIGDGSYSNNCRMYYCKIWDKGALVRDFVPCYRKADNKPGMYDKVNDVFYTNDGSGEFTLGPEV